MRTDIAAQTHAFLDTEQHERQRMISDDEEDILQQDEQREEQMVTISVDISG